VGMIVAVLQVGLWVGKSFLRDLLCCVYAADSWGG